MVCFQVACFEVLEIDVLRASSGVADRYLAVTPDEAKQVGDEVYLDPSRGYHSVG